MHKFKVTFIKVPVLTGIKAPNQLIEQIYFTDTEKIDIRVPVGYGIAAVTEYLPDINQEKEKQN